MDCNGRWLISSIGFKARRTTPYSQSVPNLWLNTPGVLCSALNDWNQIYRASNGPPWDIGRPQPAFISLVKNHEMIPPGTVLDVGCGTGENAIFYAQNKFTVSGLDLARAAIDQARSKAKERNVNVDFQEGNALALDFKAGSFDYVTDSGLFQTQKCLFHDVLLRQRTN